MVVADDVFLNEVKEFFNLELLAADTVLHLLTVLLLIDQLFYTKTGIYDEEVVVIQTLLVLFHNLVNDEAEEKYQVIINKVQTK